MAVTLAPNRRARQLQPLRTCIGSPGSRLHWFKEPPSKINKWGQNTFLNQDDRKSVVEYGRRR
jgi:hypothetical protein